MFVALSKFTIANDMELEVKEAFRNRPHLVDQVKGFVRLDVISPENRPQEIWLITYWDTKENFEKWHKSPEHKSSHRHIPKGLKLIPKETELCYFEHVSS